VYYKSVNTANKLFGMINRTFGFKFKKNHFTETEILGQTS